MRPWSQRIDHQRRIDFAAVRKHNTAHPTTIGTYMLDRRAEAHVDALTAAGVHKIRCRTDRIDVTTVQLKQMTRPAHAVVILTGLKVRAQTAGTDAGETPHKLIVIEDGSTNAERLQALMFSFGPRLVAAGEPQNAIRHQRRARSLEPGKLPPVSIGLDAVTGQTNHIVR